MAETRKPPSNSTNRTSAPRIQSAVRTRGGRRFEPIEERRLLKHARSALSQLPGSQDGVCAFSEFNAPYGVPDVTAVVGSSNQRLERLRLKVDPLLNEIDAGIVSATDTARPQSARQIAYRLRWDIESVERRLPEVLKAGALTEADRGKYVKPEGLAPIGDLYAIETKVKDWRRAVQQCRTYLLWADSYILVLDRLSESARPEVIATVTQDRGGLVVGGETLRHARVSQRRKARRLWASEHVIAEFVERRRR